MKLYIFQDNLAFLFITFCKIPTFKFYICRALFFCKSKSIFLRYLSLQNLTIFKDFLPLKLHFCSKLALSPTLDKPLYHKAFSHFFEGGSSVVTSLRPPMTKLNTRDRDADLVIFVYLTDYSLFSSPFLIAQSSLCFIKSKRIELFPYPFLYSVF